MSASSPPPGTVGWTDLTVDDAEKVRDFYRKVVGWSFEPVDMGGYSDFTMIPPATGQPVAGVCHARGANAELPPVWMIYLIVEDLAASVAACEELGGDIIVAPKSMGGGQYCVISDPAGAVCALYQPLG